MRVGHRSRRWRTLEGDRSPARSNGDDCLHVLRFETEFHDFHRDDADTVSFFINST